MRTGSSIVNVIIQVVVVALVAAILVWILGAVGAPSILMTVVWILAAVVVVVLLLGLVRSEGLGGPGRRGHVR